MRYKLFVFGSTSLSWAILLGGVVDPASAQQFVFGGGINGGSLPRALAPLCNGARRLDGGGLSASAALVAGRLRLSANVDHVAKIGGMSVAECVAGTGIAVDSSFAEADRSAFTLSGTAWLRAASQIDLGVETGWVVNHESWFIGPAFGAHHGRVRAEIIARLHVNSFEEVTRDYTISPVRELSRRDAAERSWGLAARVLLVTGRR